MTYAASFIGQAMTESAETGVNGWQFELEFGHAARFAACGLANLLSGPILFLAGGVWYWIHCGRMTPLDWLIFAELVLVGIGSWLLLSCGSAASGRFALNRPKKLWSVMRRLGCHGISGILAGSLIITLHIAGAVFACQQIQSDSDAGLFVLGGCAFSGIFVTTLLLSRLSRMSARRVPGFG